jgi:hypothetical protein
VLVPTAIPLFATYNNPVAVVSALAYPVVVETNVRYLGVFDEILDTEKLVELVITPLIVPLIDPPTYKLPPIPTPPDTTNAPVSVLADVVVLLTKIVEVVVPVNDPEDPAYPLGPCGPVGPTDPK